MNKPSALLHDKDGGSTAGYQNDKSHQSDNNASNRHVHPRFAKLRLAANAEKSIGATEDKQNKVSMLSEIELSS